MPTPAPDAVAAILAATMGAIAVTKTLTALLALDSPVDKEPRLLAAVLKPVETEADSALTLL